MQSQKPQYDLYSFPRQTIHSNPSLCPNHRYQESWNWPVLWRSTTPFRINNNKERYFIIGDLNGKVGSQEIPGLTDKFGLGVQNEAGHSLTDFCQENMLVIANNHFQQPKRWLNTWVSLGGQYWNQIDCVLCNQKWKSSMESVFTDCGANCGSDHEPLLKNSDLN